MVSWILRLSNCHPFFLSLSSHPRFSSRCGIVAIDSDSGCPVHTTLKVLWCRLLVTRGMKFWLRWACRLLELDDYLLPDAARGAQGPAAAFPHGMPGLSSPSSAKILQLLRFFLSFFLMGQCAQVEHLQDQSHSQK